jgi:hypothetical protein
VVWVNPPKTTFGVVAVVCGAVFYAAAMPPKSRKKKTARAKARPAVRRGKPIELYLLADTERLENFDHARRVRAALCRAAHRHFRGRAIYAEFFGDFTEQPDTCNRRSRWSRWAADLGFRVRRYPAISRPQVR